MAIAMKYICFDKMFSNVRKYILLNDLDPDAVDEKLEDELYLKVDGEILSTIPQCVCGHLKHAMFKNIECPKCHSKVTDLISLSMPLVWIETPEGVERLMSPDFWNKITSNITSPDKFDVLRWLCDLRYNPKLKVSIIPLTAALKEHRLGYNYVINNLSEILYVIANSAKIKASGKRSTFIKLIQIYENEKDIILNTHMPLLNRKFNVVEQTQYAGFRDLKLGVNTETVLNFIRFSKAPHLRDRERCIAKTISGMAETERHMQKKYYAKKTSVWRQHVNGSRSFFTARCVMTLYNGPHTYNHVELPWGVGITLLRVHIMSLMLKDGYTYNYVHREIINAVDNGSHVIESYVDRLFKLAPNNRFALTIMRNPTLSRLSILRVWCVKIKRHTKITTISVSPLLLSALRGDIDGDEINISLLIDNYMTYLMKPLDLENGILGSKRPFGYTKGLNFFDPAVSMTAVYQKHERMRIDKKEHR